MNVYLQIYRISKVFWANAYDTGIKCRQNINDIKIAMQNQWWNYRGNVLQIKKYLMHYGKILRANDKSNDTTFFLLGKLIPCRPTLVKYETMASLINGIQHGCYNEIIEFYGVFCSFLQWQQLISDGQGWKCGI